MAEYIMKPGIIKAVQWTGKNLQEIQELIGMDNIEIVIKTPFLKTKLEPGNYVIKNEKGNIDVMEQRVFAFAYKQADDLPIIRCRECVYREKANVNKKGFLICPASGMEITDDAFCSYGTRTY